MYLSQNYEVNSIFRFNLNQSGVGARLFCFLRTSCLQPLAGAVLIVLASGAELPVEALTTPGTDRGAHLLTKPHQKPVDLRPLVFREPGLEADSSLLRSLDDIRVSPTKPCHDPVAGVNISM